jgi:ankyrin repeat protein
MHLNKFFIAAAIGLQFTAAHALDSAISGIAIAVLKDDAASLAVQLDQFYKKNKALDQRAENATLLVAAILLQKANAIAVLLSRPVDLNSPVQLDSCDRKNGLQQASAYKAFCNTSSKLPRDWMDVSFTPLQTTCITGDLVAMQRLVQAGAQVFTRKSEEDALGACVAGKKFALAEYLIDQGANVQAENLSLSPLMSLSMATANAPDQAVALTLAEKMIQRGADPHYVAKGRFSELSAAARAGNLAMVQLLVQRGVDSQTPSDAGLTPLGYAQKYKQQAVIEFLESQPLR